MLSSGRSARVVGLVVVVLACACGPKVHAVTVVPETVSLYAIGAKASVRAKVVDAKGSAIGDVKVEWTSSDPSIATVEDGYVVAHANGQAVVTAVVKGIRGSAKVRVVGPAKLAIEPKTWQGVVGQEQEFLAHVQDPDGFGVPGAVPEWTVSDPHVIQFDHGTALASAPGDTTLTVRVGSLSDQATIHVVAGPPVIEQVVVDPQKATLEPGRSRKLSAYATDERSRRIPDARIEWSSSDDRVALVTSGGEVRALKAGTAKITAKAANRWATCTIVVEKK